MPRARILYVHHRPELGGAPASLSQLLSALDPARFEAHVYCPPGPAAELFRSAGAIVHPGTVAAFTHIWASTYKGRRWLLFARELTKLPRHLAELRRTLRTGNYDLVHLNDSPLVAAAWLASRRGIPVVWHLRSALATGGRGRRANALRTIIRRLAAASIAINRNVADVFDVGARVIPNTVDLEHFRPGDRRTARAELGLSPERPVVAYFGFIYPSKGFREFIQAAALLRARGLDVTYLIVGGDVRGEPFFATLFGRTLKLLGLARNYEHEAEHLVSDLGLERCFRFIAFTPDTALLYQASDIVVAPSRGPELGRPVLEASACGRVVVASGSVDGAGLIIPEETGMLVPKRSPDVLAAALESLLGDRELRDRMGSAARRHAETTFDIERNAGRVVAIYEDLLARR